MNLELNRVKLNETYLDYPPEIPKEINEQRCKRAYKESGSDWFIVYADREHSANMLYLCGFDPRFEQAVLVLGKNNQKILIVGNEGYWYADNNIVRIDAEIVLCQSFSLMGQQRDSSKTLFNILKDIGIKKGDKVSVAGWKYLEGFEYAGQKPMFFAPSFLIDSLRDIIQDNDLLIDGTRVLMHPEHGLRMQNEPEQLLTFEWTSIRASRAVHGIISNIKSGMTEFEAASYMDYRGEPFSVHMMLGSGKDDINGLRSPTNKIIEYGDGIAAAVGYWGSLCSRGGILTNMDTEFLEKIAKPYLKSVIYFYENVKVGLNGGQFYDEIVDILAKGNLKPAVNCGHGISFDEWVHSPVYKGSKDNFRSTTLMQCDIIPTPMPKGYRGNCEDTVVIADEALRKDIKARFPEFWDRIQTRRKFMKEQLGINISEDLLPLSDTCGYYIPFWLENRLVLTVK